MAQSRATFPVLAALAGGVMAISPAAGMSHELFARVSLQIGKVFWLALTLVAFVLLISALLERSRPPIHLRLLRSPYRIAWVGPLLVLLTGSSPYLGLNTERALTVFSNLRTEADGWNHYFLPRGLRLFGFQDEIYNIVTSSDPYLRRRVGRRESVVRFELQRRLSMNPDASLTYSLDGQVHRLAHASDEPELTRPVSPVLAKLFWFRPVPQNDACVH